MLISSLFGFDEQILKTYCNESEVSRYKLIGYWFLSLIAIISFSAFCFFDLLSGDVIVSIVGAVVLTYMFFSLLRFSMISIALKETKVSRHLLLFKKTNLIRMTLFTFVIFLISVPLAEFSSRQEIELKLDQYKEQRKIQFEKQLNFIFNNRTAQIQKEVQLAKKVFLKARLELDKPYSDQIELGQKKFIYERSKSRFNALQHKLNRLTKKVNKELTLKNIKFDKQMGFSTLPIVRYTLVFQHQNARLHVLLFVLFFGAILPVFILALAKDSHNYRLHFVAQFNSAVVEDYNLSTLQITSFLAKKFAHNYKECSIYEDSPFNTKLKKSNAVKVENVDLYDFLGNKNFNKTI